MAMGTLYLVATPIGNLEDVTLRALRILREVSVIAAEDTRRTKKLLAHYEIHTSLLSYHEHNKQAQGIRLMEMLKEGDVALVSDAGTPGLSDPGYELVRAALESGHPITSIPGPSAPIAALVASGLPTDAFVFLGYLPRRQSDRRKLLESLADAQRTLLFFEVPHRVKGTLEDLEDVFGGERKVAICRELTKVHEEVLRGTFCQMRLHFEAVEPRGEFTLVVAGKAGTGRWQEGAVREAVKGWLAKGKSPSETARCVAGESGWARRDVYRIIMEDK
jgi:16S rRNA (cytidine1402-2'-O)-methyltransferase